MSELISVIVPVYNVEKYLTRCVDSILNQSYKNFELILVDDGSPDQSGVICDEYALKDKRIEVIHKENKGISDARNIGLEYSKGTFITFIDSDDLVHAYYLEHLYRLIKMTNADIVIGNFVSSTIVKESIFTETTSEIIHELSSIEALELFTSTFITQMVVAWGKLYKKELFADIRFPLGKLHEDDFTTYKLIYKAHKVVITSKPLLFYFKHKNSMTGSGINITKCLDKAEALLERAAFFGSIQQIKLMNGTYKMAFSELRILLIHINYNLSLLSIKELTRFKAYRKKLLICKIDCLHKILYTSFFIYPQLVDKVYLNIKRFRKNNE